MDEKSTKRQRRARNLVIDLVTLFVVVIVAVLVLVLLGQRDSGTSDTSTTLKIVGLHCERSGVDNPYFEKTNPTSGRHSISANFNGGELMNMMYEFTGYFPSGTDFSKVKTLVHANFDLDLGNRYVHADSAWDESFSYFADDNSVKMSVYSDGKNLKASAARVFGLDHVDNFPKTLKSAQEAYENQGYTCEVKE